MSVKKAFVYYDSVGAPIPLHSILLKDKAGLLANVPMVHNGEGVYEATVDAAMWAVWDITNGLPGVDTGFVLDTTGGISAEPAIPGSTSNKFLDGTKTFRIIQIADVQGLQAALDSEATARASAVSSEATARASADSSEAAARAAADTALASRITTLEASSSIDLVPVVYALGWNGVGFQVAPTYSKASVRVYPHVVRFCGRVEDSDPVGHKLTAASGVIINLEHASLPVGEALASFEGNGCGHWIGQSLTGALLEGEVVALLNPSAGGYVALTFKLYTGSSQRDLTWADLGVLPRITFEGFAMRSA